MGGQEPPAAEEELTSATATTSDGSGHRSIGCRRVALTQQSHHIDRRCYCFPTGTGGCGDKSSAPGVCCRVGGGWPAWPRGGHAARIKSGVLTNARPLRGPGGASDGKPGRCKEGLSAARQEAASRRQQERHQGGG